MSELSNPIFDNEREFLERQKEEYKNALMGDVDQIKSQGQEIGRKAAAAGGVLLAGYLLKRMFSGGRKKAKSEKEEKAKKRKDRDTKPVASHPATESYVAASRVVAPSVSTPLIDYDSIVHEQEDDYTVSSGRMHHADSGYAHQQEEATAKNTAKKIIDSPVTKVLTQQAMAFLLMYAGKKLEEYLHGVSENDDIAATPAVEVIEIETTEYIVPKEDAI